MRSWNREGEYDQPPEYEIEIDRRDDRSPWRATAREAGRIRGIATVADDGASVVTGAYSDVDALEEEARLLTRDMKLDLKQIEARLVTCTDLLDQERAKRLKGKVA